MFGGTNMTIPPICSEPLAAGLIKSSARPLKEDETEGLWRIFAAINDEWRLFHTRDPKHPVADASNLRSTWLEFVTLRADSGNYPSYVGEYENALEMLRALESVDGADAVKTLLFAEEPSPDTRLAHAKRYVVDEFITVMVIASGFKEFGARNYNGFIGGSRFNRATNICTPVLFPEREAEQ